MQNSLMRRLEGLGWIAAIVVAAWLVLSGPIDRILIADEALNSSEMLSFQHASRLARPPVKSAALKYRSYVFSESDAEAMGPGDIQAKLISIAKDNKTKLVDLRVLDSDESIEAMIAKRFRLDIEGDLIAITDVLKSLGGAGQPVLISELSLSPVGQHDRPDRRLRASLELSFWEMEGDQ